MATDDFYEWTPLQEDEDTRLIQLQPSKSFTDPVQCDISHIALKDPPHYRTVSYAWGPTFPDGSHLTDIIYVNGKPMRVTRTLNMALKRLREDRPWSLPDWRNSRAGKLPIWIDAISIDQRDPIEKAAQVLKMSLIFEKSRHLTIWLGEPEHEAEVHECSDLSQKFWEWETRPAAPEITLANSEKAFLLRTLGLWWFRRRWIVQEVIVTHTAGRTPLFRYGEAVWNWPFFVDAVDQLPSSPATDRFVKLNKRAVDDIALVDIFSTINSGSILGSANRSMSHSLLQTLHAFDQAECYDPRDKIYSLLSVGWGLSDRKAFSIDYESTVNEVYINLATSLLHTGDTNFLIPVLAVASCRQSQDPTCQSSLPSWVPDWRRPITYRNANHQKAVEYILRRTLSIRFDRLQECFDIEGKRLELRCFLFGHSPKHTSPEISDYSIASLLAAIGDTIQEMKTLQLKYSSRQNKALFDNCEESKLMLQSTLEEMRRLPEDQCVCLIPEHDLGFILRRSSDTNLLLDQCFLISYRYYRGLDSPCVLDQFHNQALLKVSIA